MRWKLMFLRQSLLASQLFQFYTGDIYIGLLYTEKIIRSIASIRRNLSYPIWYFQPEPLAPFDLDVISSIF